MAQIGRYLPPIDKSNHLWGQEKVLNLHDTSPLGVYIFEVNAYEIKGITFSRIGKKVEVNMPHRVSISIYAQNGQKQPDNFSAILNVKAYS